MCFHIGHIGLRDTIFRVLLKNFNFYNTTMTKKIIDEISYKIIGAAIEVHKILGPGLLENVYEKALFHELQLRGLNVKKQQKIIVFYKGIPLDIDFRYDLLVEDAIICELKSVLDVHPVYIATLLSYLTHLRKPKGILMNFNVVNFFKEGQKTYVNEFYKSLPDE